MHPLYPIAKGLRGRYVNAYHVNGRVYCGFLQRVTPHGIYLMTSGARTVGMTTKDEGIEQAIEVQHPETQTELVYSPLGYFGFGALTGLTLGALAGGGFYW